MDHAEVYEFVCMFPFLIDQSVMMGLIESEIQDSKLIQSLIQESQLSISFEESSSSASSCPSRNTQVRLQRNEMKKQRQLTRLTLKKVLKQGV